ncbi:hypothetical protein [Marinobacter orientalis]|uniref:Uncharacterized protein n=1 Tax=Marinobacter orientalis TaxID=1928859 RepID=A0A7Y0REZ5_9GAMM|nr:hypothetical protein [Marinobacter orientalis]NMT64985.1 hypothetical protein [Marinobacter orientalis]TGX48123.1 hypothetical protein DIT72_16005 [Marinobacter orientalis]
MSDILFQPLGDPIAGGDNLEKLADIDPRMTRTHYFDGRLLTAEDLERDQIYLDQRLREVGKALGSGIINGLELSFSTDPYRLVVEPGKAMTPAGRVLHLGTRMTVNPGDKALISQLNDGRHRHFNRGLYAVVLRYVDVPTDIAEVFPTDLKNRRGSDYALVTESIQLGLVPLPLALPALDTLRLRARLMAELLDNKLASSVVPEDSVALGVLAIAQDTPQWVDNELLRHPIRPEPDHNDLQEDLHRQYQSLLGDIIGHRAGGGLDQPFAAADYFPIIPPAGGLPRNAVDPQKGYHSYFPASFDVAVAPVREADLELIRRESMGLPAIDLNRDSDVSVMVLAPLSDKDYWTLSRQLVADNPPNERDFLYPDPLALRLYRKSPSHNLDTDASVWGEIWNRIDSDSLIYVRRPVRAAETGISGIILAQGASIPDAQPENDGDADTQPEVPTEIEDEHTIFLRMVNVPSLAKVRPANSEAGEESIKALTESLPRELRAIRAVLDTLLRVERHYDPVIWQTLEQAQQQDNLLRLRDLLMEAEPDIGSTARHIIRAGADLGLAENLLQQWKEQLDALR